jgi:hypothetical protein
MPFSLQIIGMIVIVAACMLPFVVPNWRTLITTLAAIYLIQFIYIFYLSAPLLAAINLIIGWMACAVIGISSLRLRVKENIEPFQKGIAFRLISEFFFILTAFAISINANSWLPKIPYIVFAAGLTLLFTGLLQLNYFPQTLRIVVSLLVLLSGFELIYYSIEFSLLVIILIGFIKLGLAFIGTYIIGLQLQEEVK